MLNLQSSFAFLQRYRKFSISTLLQPSVILQLPTTSPNEVTLYSHVKAHSHKLHFMLWTVADHCVSTEIEALQCFLSVEMQWPIAFPEWIAASLNEP